MESSKKKTSRPPKKGSPLQTILFFRGLGFCLRPCRTRKQKEWRSALPATPAVWQLSGTSKMQWAKIFAGPGEVYACIGYMWQKTTFVARVFRVRSAGKSGDGQTFLQLANGKGFVQFHDMVCLPDPVALDVDEGSFDLGLSPQYMPHRSWGAMGGRPSLSQVNVEHAVECYAMYLWCPETYKSQEGSLRVVNFQADKPAYISTSS